MGPKKTAFGGNVYPDKAALVDVLEKILEEMKFSHFGKRKPTDKKDVIGYMNFSENATVDNQKKHLKIAIQIRRGGKFYYNIDGVDVV